MVISRSFQLPARVYQDTLFPCIPGSVGWVQTSSSMSASQALQHLYSLDKSSSEFLRAVYKFTRLDENGECSFNLQQSESARLVDFLDEVQIPVQPHSTRFQILNIEPLPTPGAGFNPSDRCIVSTLSSSTAPGLRLSQHFTFIAYYICWAEHNGRTCRCVRRVRRCLGRNAWKRKSVRQSVEDLQCKNE